jgi:WXG100 family type VII secretion target
VGGSEIRGSFDDLERLAASFSGQADETRRLLQQLQRQVDELQGGGWVGRGAKAFYSEMNDKVTPAVNSLAGALDSAAQNTQKASQVMQQAELEVTRLFSAEDVRGPVAAGPAGAALDAAGAASAAGAAAVARREIEAATATAMEALRSGEDAAIDKMLSKFDEEVRHLAKKSPTLRAELLQLQKAGFKIKTGPIADGYYTNKSKKVIVIDQPLSSTETVAHLAHEVGHGVSKLPDKIAATPTMTKAQYIKANVDNSMRDEGMAQFNAAKVRAEIKATRLFSAGPDIGMPGSQTAAYQKVYDNFTKGKLTQAQAVDQMRKLMEKETVSGNPPKPYPQYYRDEYSDDWDQKIAPGRRSK